MIKDGDGPTESPKDTIFTAAELEQFDGTDESMPIYLAVKQTVFDVSKSRKMYGPGGSYRNFAGRDASRALGMSSTKIENCVSDYFTLDDEQLKVLEDWEKFFKKKYNIVGTVKSLNH
ncbi:MAG: hypothetical protein SGCHY_005540 [Lobulomycetales sp.]